MAAWLHSCTLKSHVGLALELQAGTAAAVIIATSALQSRPASLNIGASR